VDEMSEPKTIACASVKRVEVAEAEERR